MLKDYMEAGIVNTKYRDFKEYFEKKYGLQLTKINNSIHK